MVNKMKLMKNYFDVPYSKTEIDSADRWAESQAKGIVKRIYTEATDIKEQIDKNKKDKGADFIPLEDREIIAMIAYLQRLGTDIKTTQVKTASVD